MTEKATSADARILKTGEATPSGSAPDPSSSPLPASGIAGLEQMREALEFAKGAITDAICLEDGLDGLAGRREVLPMSANLTIRESRRVVRPRELVLDHALRLPTTPRLSRGLRTVCDACRESITEPYFYGGFVAGHKNLLLHERCTPEAMRTHSLTGEPLSVGAVDPQGERVTE